MACPTGRDIFMPPSGPCRLVCNIQILKRHEGEPKNAMCATFAPNPFIEYGVVVDSDIDIFDDSSVLRAFATRVKVGEDVFVIRNAKGHPLDLTATEGFLVEKVAIDSTKPLTGYPETIAVPDVDELDLDVYFVGRED